MYRKIQKTTTGTYFVTLPKNWIEMNKIKHGDMVDIEIRKDGALIIYPTSHISREKENKVTIPYRYGEMSSVSDIIMGAYLLGYDIIEVISLEDGIEPKDREEIRRFVQFFIGLEVLDESERTIIIRSILDPSYTDPSKLLKRMAYLVEDMLRDGFKAILNGDNRLASFVTQRDREVNRVYFLLIRLLRGALRNPMLADRYNLNPLDYLDYRVAAKTIESIGDIAANLMPYIREAIEDEAIKAIFDEVIDMYRLAVDIFFEKSMDKRKIIENLEREMNHKINNLKGNARNLSDLIRWFIRESVDLADLAITLSEET
jgi:phosphate transport system protein